MRHVIATGLAVLLVSTLGCSDDYPTATGEDLAAPRPASAKAGPFGTCPDIYYESDKTLDNGAIVTWRSSFGGFNYTQGQPYTVTVVWGVQGGSATFVGFGPKNRAWTPKGVGGTVPGTAYPGSTGSNSMDLTVNMNPMHWAVEPDWQGYIGNGHFKLELDVDGIATKLGVNVHLEDPDGSYGDRCP
ncbi:MAG: hypothetical protein ACE5JM_14230 [Armatimonadota bacterium]